MDEVGQKRKIAKELAMDTSETLPGRRGRALVGAVENSEEFPGNQEERCCAGDLHLAFDAKTLIRRHVGMPRAPLRCREGIPRPLHGLQRNVGVGVERSREYSLLRRESWSKRGPVFAAAA